MPTYRDEETLALVDLVTGQEGSKHRAHAKHITSVDVTPDGRLAVSGSEDNTVRLWNLGAHGGAHTKPTHHASVNAVALSADASRAVSGAADGSVKVWDLQTGRETCEFEASAPVSTLLIHAEGKTAITVGKPLSGGYVVEVWDLASSVKKPSPPTWDSTFTCLTTTADGRYAAVASYSTEQYTQGNVCIFDLELGSSALAWSVYEETISTIAAVPGTHQILASSGRSGLVLYDIASGKRTATLNGHQDFVTRIALSHDGRFALSGSWDCSLILWDLRSLEAAAKLTGHSKRILALAITPDGQYAISAAEDGTVRVWDLWGRKQRRVIQRDVQNVAITPDGVRAILITPTAVEVVLLENGKLETSFPCTWIGASDVEPASSTLVVGEAGGEVHLLQLILPPQ